MLPCVFAVNEKFLSAINIAAGYHTTLSRKLTRIYRMNNMSALNIVRYSQHSEDSMISLKRVHFVSASLLAFVVLFSNSSAFAQIDLSGDWAVRIQEDQ